MERQEAVEFDKELKDFLEDKAIHMKLKKGTGFQLVDQYVEIYPDESPMLGMIDLKEEGSVCVKPGNVLVNQKKILMEAGVDLAVSFTIPEIMLNYIQLCLLIGIAVYKSARIELSENESYVVAYLHSHQMYDRGEEESLFYLNFPVWYIQQTGDEISDKRLKQAVEKLLFLRTISMEEGEIRLKEKVWRNRLNE